MTAEWRPFSYSRKEETRPPRGDELVWIFDEFYHGVTVGYFDGFTFRHWSGSDDVSVTHWAPLEKPEAPQNVTP